MRSAGSAAPVTSGLTSPSSLLRAATGGEHLRYIRRLPARASCISPGWAAQPPPGTITAGSRARAVRTASRSMERNRGSPTIPKIWAIGIPIWRTRIESMSSSGAWSSSATSRPTVLFPDPGRPTSTTWRRMSVPGRFTERRPAGAEPGQVPIVVPPHLAERVAAELLQHRIGQHEGSERLGDDAHGRDRRDVRALALGVGRLAGGQVHGGKRGHERADRLHGHPEDDRLPRGDPALEAAGVVGAAAEA